MPRLFSLAAMALTVTAISGAPTTLSAAEGGVYYTAKLAAPASEDRYMAGGREWLCDGDNCIAQRSNARPLRVCRDLKRTIGTVEEFTADGRTLDAEKLAKCNAQ